MKKKLMRKWDTGKEHDRVPKCGGGGTVLPKTMNTARFYLLLLALIILTSILHANFLAQTI